MKKYFLIILLALVCMFVNAQTKSDTLTNEKVMLLLKAGLQPSLVITKIKTSITKFDVTTDGLIKLNNNGVPSDVINTMINPNSSNNLIISNDSISIYKKWKEVLVYENSILKERRHEIKMQFYNDGTCSHIFIDLKTGKKYESRGKFELSNDKKSITYYFETRNPYTVEIIKLTNKELETKGVLNGTEYHEFFIIEE